MIAFHVVSLFPESLESYLNSSIVKRAQEDGHISIKYYNPRDFAVSGGKNKKMTYAERRVDDKPYGGGPGMVMEALPIIRTIEEIIENVKYKKENNNVKIKNRNTKKSVVSSKIKIIFFTPSGKQFTNKIADTFKKYADIVLVCGRYEGIDARVKKVFPMTNVSIGPYTLTGGELPAMVVTDAVTRRIRGVLGDDLSIEEMRVASPDVYTRPEIIGYKRKKYRVPKILLSGHQKKIEEWKKGIGDRSHRK